MPTIKDLQDKIQDLQSQINATQAQINNYKNNPAYTDYYYVCPLCKNNNGKRSQCAISLSCLATKTRKIYFFTKTAELANAESTLKSLQNQLTTTQAELVEKQQAQEKAQKQAHLARLIAQCSTPPPSTDLLAIKRVLESLNTLQSKLLFI